MFEARPTRARGEARSIFLVVILPAGPLAPSRSLELLMRSALCEPWLVCRRVRRIARAKRSTTLCVSQGGFKRPMADSCPPARLNAAIRERLSATSLAEFLKDRGMQGKKIITMSASASVADAMEVRAGGGGGEAGPHSLQALSTHNISSLPVVGQDSQFLGFCDVPFFLECFLKGGSPSSASASWRATHASLTQATFFASRPALHPSPLRLSTRSRRRPSSRTRLGCQGMFRHPRGFRCSR